MDIAVLDLGSTTFHLQHLRMDTSGASTTTLDAKRSLCLGSQVFADGYLDRRSWLESLDAVWALLELSDEHKPSQRVIVATSAIRSASNGIDLIQEIERRHRVHVRILSPHEEARYAYLGQASASLAAGQRLAAVDLGGGSVEIAVGEGAYVMDAASLPVGALRMRAGSDLGAYGAQEALAIALRVRDQIAESVGRIRQLAPQLVVFGSGSARAARKLLLRDSTEPGKVGPLGVSEFRAALEQHLGHSREDLIALGVDPARASSVLVAATIMLQVLDVLEIDRAHVSDRGLRDGLAHEVFQASHAKSTRATGEADAAYA
jgi:exopolyphosphatase / guanosine-5'-triphosphate,3'-diphosphate pyrophosphatase